MVTIQQAVEGTVQLFKVGQVIYRAVAGYMDAMEGKGLSGVEKFKWVLAKAKADIEAAGKSWDDWREYISEFITTAKMLYNFGRAIF